MKIQKHIMTTQEQDIQINEITLLSKEEYLDAKENIPAIHKRWWLRSPGYYQYYAVYVRGVGSLSRSYVDIGSACVRPALKILNDKSSNLNIGDKFNMAGYTWTVILEGTALCDTVVGNTCFRKDWKSDDANKYDASDIKKWLESWAEEKGLTPLQES